MTLMPTGSAPTDQPRSILSQVLQCLNKVDKETWDQWTILLPTQRMVTHLLAALSEHHGAFWSPQVLTLDQWLIRHFSAGAPPTLPNWQEQTTLSWILGTQKFKHLQESHARELLLLFHETGTYDLAQGAWAELKSRILQDIYRDLEALDILQERVDEIARCSDLWVDELRRGGFQPHYAHKQLLVAAALREIDGWDHAFPGAGVILAGFTSLQPGPLKVLSALAKLDNAQCILVQPTTGKATAPLIDIYRQLELSFEVPQERPATAPHHSFKLKDPVAECHFVATQIKHLLNQSVPASHIGVLVTNERMYSDLLRQSMDDLNIKNRNFGMGMPLKQTMLGGALSILSDLQSPKVDYCARFVQALHHPLIEQVLADISALDLQEFRQARDLVVRNLTKIPIVNDYQDLLSHGLTKPNRTLVKLWQQLLAPKVWRESTRSLTLGDRLETTGSWLKTLRQIHLKHFAEQDVEQAAIDLSNRYFRGFLEHQQGWLCSHSQWWSWWDQHLLGIEVRPFGEPLSGVQVLSLDEARNIPFATTFVLGAQENYLPKSLPRDDLLDDYLKRAMGLPGWTALEAMEEQNFWLLLRQSQRIVFTWSQRIQNLEQVRSRFLDLGQLHGWLGGEREIDGVHLTSDLPAPLGAYQPPPRIGIELQKRPEPWLSKMSATALEKLINCPFRFALSRAGVEPIALPSGTLSATAEGEWIHSILEAFFREPVTQAESSWDETSQFEQRAFARLMELTEKTAISGALESPLYQHLKCFAWPKFARHMHTMFEGDWTAMNRQLLKEKSLRAPDQRPMAFSAEQPELVGKIDSIDCLSEGIVITDYKRGSSLPSNLQMKSGLNPQLSFYAMAILEGWTELNIDSDASFVTGYWSVKDASWHPALAHGDQVDWATNKKLSPKKPIQIEEGIKNMQLRWKWRLESLPPADLTFVADTSECGFCPHSGICRKDDAAFSHVMETQDFLDQELNRVKGAEKDD